MTTMATQEHLADVDRHDKKLLGLMSDKRYEFAKNSRQEDRLRDLVTRGLAERHWETYSFSARSGIAEHRWAYRRTRAGKDIVEGKPVK